MDAVKQPSHYKGKADPLLRKVRLALIEDLPSPFDPAELECIEGMLSHFDNIEEIRGYLRGNSFKYRWRYKGKNGLQDLSKARWYEDKLFILEQTVLNAIEELTGVTDENA